MLRLYLVGSLLGLLLLLVACGRHATSPTPAGVDPTATLGTNTLAPEGGTAPADPAAVATQFIRACEGGDLATARTLWSAQLQALLGTSDPCNGIVTDAEASEQVGVVELQGQTAYVPWAWRWTERSRRETARLVLAQEAAGWRLMTVEPEHTEETWEEQAEQVVQPEVAVQAEPTWPDTLALVAQEGAPGTQVVTTRYHKVDGVTSAEIVGEEATQPAAPWIVRQGTLPETEWLDEARAVATRYLSAYQQADWAAVVALAPDAAARDLAAANTTAQMELRDFTLTATPLALTTQRAAATTLDPHGYQERPAVAAVAGRPYAEPVRLAAAVPFSVAYSLFGVPQQAEAELWLRWEPLTDEWALPFWGVWAAGAVGEAYTLKDNTVTLQGVAVTPTHLFVAVQGTTTTPTYVSVLGDGNDAFAQVDYQLPQGQAWLNQVIDPAVGALPLELAVGFFGVEEFDRATVTIPLQARIVP